MKDVKSNLVRLWVLLPALHISVAVAFLGCSNSGFRPKDGPEYPTAKTVNHLNLLAGDIEQMYAEGGSLSTLAATNEAFIVRGPALYKLLLKNDAASQFIRFNSVFAKELSVIDAWGNPLSVQFLPQEKVDEIVIWSWGPNGIDDRMAGDDLVKTLDFARQPRVLRLDSGQ